MRYLPTKLYRRVSKRLLPRRYARKLAEQMQAKTFVFVGGLHRSGTSPLHQIMQGHPEISGFRNTGAIRGEGQHLQSIFPTGIPFGGAGRFGFDGRSFMDEHDPLVSAANAMALFEQWSKYWNLRRPYLIEKSPPTLVRSRFLQAMFPRSVFIMILRHPIAVAYATQKWSRTSIASLIDHWLLCHERFLADLPYLTRCFVLRYEELVSSPQKTIDEVYRFVGLTPVPVALDIERAVNERYFKRWAEEEQSILADLPHRYEERANCMGYSLCRTEELLPAPCLGPHVGFQQG